MQQNPSDYSAVQPPPPPDSSIAGQWNLGVRINALVGNASGSWLAAALGDGRIALLPTDQGDAQPIMVAAHEGVSLSLAPCGEDFISGGDDGRVVRITGGGAPQILWQNKGRWVDHVAADSDGKNIAFAVGKNLYLMQNDGAVAAPFEHPGSIGGLAFSPNGKRIAASHNNGVSLWWVKAQQQSRVALDWKGSHLALAWHPDGKVIVTAMQEGALHGWRLSDRHEMRMQGYAGKIHALRWALRGKWLATSGAAQAILWPFFGGGPWGKPPLVLGLDRGVLVSDVAPHPGDPLTAIGYQDGMIELAPYDGRPGVMIHPPVAEQGSAVTGLVWNKTGHSLFAAHEGGYLMLFTADSVAAAARL